MRIDKLTAERFNDALDELNVELESLRQENRRLRKALTRIKSLNYDVNHYAGVQSYLAASNALKPPRSH